MTTERMQRLKPHQTGPTPEKMSSEKRRVVAAVFGVFCMVSMLTPVFFAVAAGERQDQGLPAEGGIMGPIVVEAPNTLLQVTVSQLFKQEGWSYIEGQLRSEAGAVLFGFGDELWAESGVDGDGPWSESKYSYELRIRVPEPGTYHLAFEAEAGYVGMTSTVPVDQMVRSMVVVVRPLRGSPWPFWIASWIAGVLTTIISVPAARRRGEQLASWPWRTRTVRGVIAGLIVLYALLFVPSCRGYGYGGPAHEPSFWSLTNVDVYRNVSVRAGSRTGPGIAGGGK